MNAANSRLLGCFCPNHGCVDNAVHTFAGVQLRLACAALMRAQGHEEEVGGAKRTPAFNLPCKSVLHTVGPQVRGRPTAADEAALAACYDACLTLADEERLKNLAFCCVSTGEYGFPSERAAEVAIRAVETYRARTRSRIEVIFNVFRETDYARLPSASRRRRRGSGARWRLLTRSWSARARDCLRRRGLHTTGAFRALFADFREAYGFTDMYTGGFYPYETPGGILGVVVAAHPCQPLRRRGGGAVSGPAAAAAGQGLFRTDDQRGPPIRLAGFPKARLFYTQGDYGLWQCAAPCHDGTYDNEAAVRAMAASQRGLRVPAALLPRCPVCGGPMTMNLRCDERFVQDEGWYAAAGRCEAFLRRLRGRRVPFLELGVGANTPAVIKFPFWRMTAANPDAVYACVNLDFACCPAGIAAQSLCIRADISAVLAALEETA